MRPRLHSAAQDPQHLRILPRQAVNRHRRHRRRPHLRNQPPIHHRQRLSRIGPKQLNHRHMRVLLEEQRSPDRTSPSSPPSRRHSTAGITANHPPCSATDITVAEAGSPARQKNPSMPAGLPESDRRTTVPPDLIFIRNNNLPVDIIFFIIVPAISPAYLWHPYIHASSPYPAPRPRLAHRKRDHHARKLLPLPQRAGQRVQSTLQPRPRTRSQRRRVRQALHSLEDLALVAPGPRRPRPQVRAPHPHRPQPPP